MSMDRRRALMAQKENLGELLFSDSYRLGGASLGTFDIDGYTITMTSNQNASWDFNIGTNSGLKQIKNLLGHKILYVMEYTWNNKPSGALFETTFCLTTDSAGASSRMAFFRTPSPTDSNGKIKRNYVLSRSIFTVNSDKYMDSYYFLWRSYFYANKGGSITFNIKVYDQGVATE